MDAPVPCMGVLFWQALHHEQKATLFDRSLDAHFGQLSADIYGDVHRH